MIEQWFKQDIEEHLNQGKRVEVFDPYGNGAFLLSTLTATILGKTDVPFYTSGQVLLQKLILNLQHPMLF